MKLNRFMMIRPGDLLLVDFGTSSIRSRAMGKHPAYVISLDNPRATRTHLMVIPAFRKPSFTDSDSDVTLKPVYCAGLRYALIVNITNIQKVERDRVIKKIGHVTGKQVMKEVRSAFLKKMDGKSTSRVTEEGVHHG